MNKDRMNAAKEVYRENKISREGERAGKQLLCPLDGLSIVSNERTANDPFPSLTSFFPFPRTIVSNFHSAAIPLRTDLQSMPSEAN